jgi:hypothetical protein
MNWLVQMLFRSAETPFQADVLSVLIAFCRAGLFIFIVFAAQLVLIHQIEQGRFLRWRFPALSVFRRFMPDRERKS